MEPNGSAVRPIHMTTTQNVEARNAKHEYVSDSGVCGAIVELASGRLAICGYPEAKH